MVALAVPITASPAPSTPITLERLNLEGAGAAGVLSTYSTYLINYQALKGAIGCGEHPETFSCSSSSRAL